MSEKFDFIKYANEYKKKNYKRITALIPLNDTKVIEKLNSVKSISSYIYQLIIQDVKK